VRCAVGAREDFDRELGQLEAELALMEGMVETAIFNGLRGLAARDLETSQQVIDEDDRIDQKQLDIERDCVDLLRRQAPIAGDLRRVISILQVASELERMGDYAEGISKISLRMGHEPPIKELVDIPRMGELAVSMLKRSLEAILDNDPRAAEQKDNSLPRDDDVVD
jgi:phosphate transport system protein